MRTGNKRARLQASPEQKVAMSVSTIAQKLTRKNNGLDYKRHSIAELFPTMSADAREKLKKDIEQHGQVDPIIVKDKIVLDGWERLGICKELKKKPKIAEWEDTEFGRKNPSDDKAIAAFIWAKNFLRRHLTRDQRAALVIKFTHAVRALAKAAQKRKPKSVLAKSSKQKPVHTRKLLAEKAQVSEYTIQQAENVAKHKPELLEKVESGELKLKDAAKQAGPQQRDLDTPGYTEASDFDADALKQAVDDTMRALEKDILAVHENPYIDRERFDLLLADELVSLEVKLRINADKLRRKKSVVIDAEVVVEK